ncbi:hypothetical protein DY000_02040582 [Brassica cretica]|uniref:Uncharacterized protein n=1 Tax=Brassica cretica TaxID=69181 RepID=A0ABQ7BFX0_BRACR|nr:hypothetical protein DY000_02040582 [Brassica cretica]
MRVSSGDHMQPQPHKVLTGKQKKAERTEPSHTADAEVGRRRGKTKTALRKRLEKNYRMTPIEIGGWVTEMEEDETEKTIEWNELVDRCFRGLGLSSVFHLDRI